MSKSIERFRELTMLDGTSGFESEIQNIQKKIYLNMLMRLSSIILVESMLLKSRKKENAKTVMISASYG